MRCTGALAEVEMKMGEEERERRGEVRSGQGKGSKLAPSAQSRTASRSGESETVTGRENNHQGSFHDPALRHGEEDRVIDTLV